MDHFSSLQCSTVVICADKIGCCFLQDLHWRQMRILLWIKGSPMAQMVKNLPAMQETWVWSLGWEDPLEKGMALQYSCLGSPIDRGAQWAMPMGLWGVRDDWATNIFTFKDVKAFSTVIPYKWCYSTCPNPSTHVITLWDSLAHVPTTLYSLKKKRTQRD